MKMKERNAQLKSALNSIPTKERIEESQNIPVEDTVNRQGYAAYSLPDELRLISMLNTLKLEPQYYRSENETMKELRDLIERIGSKDPYFVAQAIVYSRCMRDGMRSINHLGAALLAPFASKQEWAKRFYGPFDKKNKRGGCIYRVDDMSEIKDVFSALNKSSLTNSMKKGFAKVIEQLDTYQLAKYRKTIIDIANLVHPNSKNSNALIKNEKNEDVKTLDAIMQGITVTADTWEAAQSDAGQKVAEAVKQGKITKEDAEKVLKEAKNDNWESLLTENKLGILAALRNIRNMMKEPRTEVIDKLCALISDKDKIRKGLIMPYQMDSAYEILRSEFASYDKYNQVCAALTKGYEDAIPNIKEKLHGKTCIMVDCSGSMNDKCRNGRNTMRCSAIEKASLIAATLAKATDADIVRFGSYAEYFKYNKNKNVFELAKNIAHADMGGTNIPAAWELIRRDGKKYDRVILLSDNECNSSWTGNYWTRGAYKEYVHDVCSPYVYCVDFCSYGTTPLKGDKVSYYFGYGYSLFEDIVNNEFNPIEHIDKVRQVEI